MARITINQALMFLRAQASATMMGEVENIADDATDEPDVAGLSEGEILDMIRRGQEPQGDSRSARHQARHLGVAVQAGAHNARTNDKRQI